VKQGGTNWLGGTDDAEHEHDGRENEDEAVGRRGGHPILKTTIASATRAVCKNSSAAGR